MFHSNIVHFVSVIFCESFNFLDSNDQSKTILYFFNKYSDFATVIGRDQLPVL